MLSSYDLENRRRLAVELHSSGQTRQASALILGVHYDTIRRWLRVHSAGGLEAIRARRRGRPAAPERILSDDNPDTDGIGGDYDVDSDVRFATHRHPMEDMEPEPVSPHRAAADAIRSVCAWLIGNRYNAHAVAIRAHALALLATSGGLFEDSRIDALAARLRKRNGERITKQALNKAMGELRRLCLDDLKLPLPNLRSPEARAKMKVAAVKSHQKRKGEA